MRPRFLGRLGLADGISALNAALGVCAVALLPFDVALGARLVLLAAIADGLDGVVAHWRGGTPVGQHIDSLADVASFGVAPAAIVAALATASLTGEGIPYLDVGPVDALGPVHLVVAIAIPAVFAAMAVVRLAFYNAYDVDNDHTVGVQSTLAATIIAAAVLAGLPAWALVLATLAFGYLMVAPLEYPDLNPRDALVMGAVQAGAVVVPGALDGVFPNVLLLAALAYLVFGPWLYWE